MLDAATSAPVAGSDVPLYRKKFLSRPIFIE